MRPAPLTPLAAPCLQAAPPSSSVRRPCGLCDRPEVLGVLATSAAALQVRKKRRTALRFAEEERSEGEAEVKERVTLEGRPPFPPPPHVPTTWWQFAHHVTVATVGVSTLLFAPQLLPGLPLVLFMFLYGDAYSAVLHSTFDHEEALDLPLINTVAYGFQMHHAYPNDSTWGVGLYRLFCDLVRVQWIVLVLAFVFSGKTLLAAQTTYLKLLFSGYGSQVGHFWAHAPKGQRPAVVSFLQDCHILLPSKHHAQHHKPPYNENLTSVSGLTDWLVNPVLKDLPFLPSIGLWAFLTAFDVPIIEWLFSAPLLS